MARPFIDELRTLHCEDELAGHGLISDDALEVWWDGPSFFVDKEPGRLKMIGRNINGDLLTIIIEPTSQHGAWDVITGWEASSGDEAAWNNEHRRVGRK